MNSAKELFGLLPNFNKNGKIYKDFIGDYEASENPEIKNISDINTGSLFNILEWHLRFKDMAVKSARLEDATAMFLDIWGSLIGIPRPNGYNDMQYLGYIIGEILSTAITFPQLVQLFPDQHLFHALEMGFYTDFSCTDIDVLDPTKDNRIAGGIITHERNSVYIYADDFLTVSASAIATANRRKSGGTGFYIGEY